MPTLQLLSDLQLDKKWLVLGDRFVIGRLRGSDVELNDLQPDPSVSRKHALITSDGSLWHIEDGDGRGRDSRHGTYVNDRKLPRRTRHRLRDQDQIRICDYLFVFRIESEVEISIEAALDHTDSDICLRTQPAERLRLLLDISTILRGTLDADAVLDRTLEHLFKIFPQAERGLVVLRESPGGQPVIRAHRTPSGKPADPRFSSTVVRRCLETLETLLCNDLPKEFPESDSIGLLSSSSLMCTPLWAPGGTALGVVQLDTRVNNRKFTKDDLSFLLGVASQASISLSNASLYREKLALQQRTRDLELAQQVQRSLLPRTLPKVPGYQFYTYYEAAQEVGGDYFDFVPLPDGRLAVLLGDVAGKGVAAALVVAKFSVEARVCLENIADPAAAVDRLNALMIKTDMPDKFVTLALAVLDPATHTIVVVNAGHPSPLLLHASGAVDRVATNDISGLPIGIVEGNPYMSREVRLGPGDRLLLFSDGVTEAMDTSDDQFREEGIRNALGVRGISPLATGEQLLQAVKLHTAGCGQTDDITVVCFGRLAS